MSKSAQQNSGRFSHESNVKQAFQLCEVLGGYACEAVCDHERRPLFWKNPGAVVQDSECRDRPLPLKIDLYLFKSVKVHDLPVVWKVWIILPVNRCPDNAVRWYTGQQFPQLRERPSDSPIAGNDDIDFRPCFKPLNKKRQLAKAP